MTIPPSSSFSPSFRLRDGETILWSGAPDPTIRFSAMDVVAIPFSLVWAGFALFWNVGVWGSGAPLTFRLFGLPFLLVGAYISVGRFFISAQRKKKTQYYVTNQRAVIINDLGQERFVELANVMRDTKQLRNNRGVTISFRSPSADTSIGIGASYVDQRLTGYSTNRYQLASPNFVFQGVSDAVGLLGALQNAPSA